MSLGPLAVAVRNGRLALEPHVLDREPAAVESAAFVLHEWLRPGDDVAQRQALEVYARTAPELLEDAEQVLEQLEEQLCEWRQEERYAELERKNPAATVSEEIRALIHKGYPHRQAIAAALSMERAGKIRRRSNLGGPMSDHDRAQADEFLERLYRQLYDTMRRMYPMTPRQPPDLVIDPKARTTERSYAFFRYDPDDTSRGNCAVYVSPLLGQDQGHAEGVIAHELGHYVDYYVGSTTKRGEEILRQRIHDEHGYPYAAAGWPLPKSPERLADAIAESYLGRPIYYESDCLVQTTDPAKGLRPRPRGLG